MRVVTFGRYFKPDVKSRVRKFQVTNGCRFAHALSLMGVVITLSVHGTQQCRLSLRPGGGT